MAANQKLLDFVQRISVFDLPVGVYAVSPDGAFVAANVQVREMLGLPPAGLVGASIERFYEDPALREVLIGQLHHSPNKRLSNQLIAFRRGARQLFVEDHCMAIIDDCTSETIGYLGCLIDITSDHNYRLLFDNLPTGVYSLDGQDIVTEVNPALVSMMEYHTSDEIVGRRVSDLYADPAEVASVREDVLRSRRVVNRRVELTKSTGETMFASVNAHALFTDDGTYCGRQGTITNVTTEEQYRRILQDVPVGFYLVRIEDGTDVIRHCNQQFARMFDFDEPEDALGTPIIELYRTRDEYRRFLEEISLRDKRKEPVLGYHLPVRTRSGRNIVIEVNSRLLHDREDRIYGRAGVVRDITTEYKLRQKIKELAMDIGSLMHIYSSTLGMIKGSIDGIRLALLPDDFRLDVAPSYQEMAEALRDPVKELVQGIGSLLELRDDPGRAGVLDSESWDRLSGFREQLDRFWQIPYPEFQPPAFRDTAIKVDDILANASSGFMPREMLRAARTAAHEVVRVVGLISLHQAADAVISTEYQARTLREYVTMETRPRETPVLISVAEIVHKSVSNVSDFARSRNVAIRSRLRDRGAYVEVIERDAVRALGNLLHNAIKYSWTRQAGEAPWVTLHTEISDGFLLIEVENWGVPIPRDEIEQGLIFEIGFRGRLSTDRGRTGTGIGLSDARHVARDHGGDITVESRPSQPGGRPEDHTQPFITRFAMRLRLSIQEKEE